MKQKTAYAEKKKTKIILFSRFVGVVIVSFVLHFSLHIPSQRITIYNFLYMFSPAHYWYLYQALYYILRLYFSINICLNMSIEFSLWFKMQHIFHFSSKRNMSNTNKPLTLTNTYGSKQLFLYKI